LFLNLTLLHNVLLALQALEKFHFQIFRPITHYKGMYNQAEDILSQWGLWEKRDSLVKDLSYGQQRIVEICLGMALNPRILLLDEPTAGLSSKEANDLINIIRNFGSKVTLILVAHDMDVVFDLADIITVLHEGQILVEGTSNEIQQNSKVREIYMGTGEWNTSI